MILSHSNLDHVDGLAALPKRIATAHNSCGEDLRGKFVRMELWTYCLNVTIALRVMVTCGATPFPDL